MNRKIISAALAGLILATTARPAHSNPAMVAAPALCSTGVGCVFVGVAVIGGLSYYVWQNSQTGDRYHQPVYSQGTDPGNVPGKQETHGVTQRSACKEMEHKFQQQGRRVRLARVIRSSNRGAVLRYICVFEGEDAQYGYYDRYRR
ncbi:hypothetical protein NIES2135_26900 [Leptolyngbya boryana NIES-2135]|jgi:hypothetical protein|uniref:Lipoprotein n=1 Tax=Leptolyngbya boryana NIES-2135 TaxID=1973484 RepID=A0A1Z4JGG2_LEPBY|nr:MULTISPECIES: hypothetical protein [Leptolyngbya]BAY55865.1 hypothetical protein NIES2135_26900 [Leptolyngbya boryana NIES-2135]MBD2368827.1 hypothetical protein [Leptolyngbya sp. FACHB-161]MBD2375305.1 hypothetical protein [Leptolyngbya sp. FACHB-238]MBD2399723.1 hypothetical protein [Leptolyngbya sp. FACHB-239]MBD2405929.1 hypothetical protein [Leptolyngbya sp. FACHB-402]